MTKTDRIELIKLLEEKKRREKEFLYLEYFNMFYDWQMDFCAATKDHFECCLMAANQIGKTLVGTTIDAIHLLGSYPENWPGHKFEKAPLMWCLGYSMEKTRDLLQTALFGVYDKNTGFKGGLVPKKKIVSWESATGIPNAVRTVKVKHESGGTSTIQFWSYSQGQHAIMGDVVDWFHIDEEPKDQTIRPQVLTRTINGDMGRGGRGIYTFTPENGRTDLVIQFMDTPTKEQFFMQRGWSDAPHMTGDKRDRLLMQYPSHQRDMRSRGTPMLGHGRIYDIPDENLVCDPFEIPDYWRIILGIDFGGMGANSHPTAIIKLAYDLEQDMLYITNSWKGICSANDAWGATYKWAAGHIMAWPADGLEGEKGRTDSIPVKDHYNNAGFKMLHTHAVWVDGSRSVEAGIYEITDRARKSKLKFFKGQQDLIDEWRQYHRDEKGKIVSVKDDILAAIRYGVMMLRYAQYNKEKKDKKIKLPDTIPVMGIK